MGSERQEREALDELAAPAPDPVEQGGGFYRHESLESQRRSPNDDRDDVDDTEPQNSTTPSPTQKLLPKLYTISHLTFFSILGALARLGIIALTTYPGAPNANTVLWANVGGCLIIGFLREDRMLFRHHWNRALRDAQDQAQEKAQRDGGGGSREEQSSAELSEQSRAQALEAFNAQKATLHIYIGMAVGFCGSFTSFADIIRDAFLALSNDFSTARVSTLVTVDVAKQRPDGDSVMAVLGVVGLQVGMSTAALQLGAHLAAGMERCSGWFPELGFEIEELLNKVISALGLGLWTGTIVLAIWPPHAAWRGQVVFAIVFAPLGCLLRFYLALWLNRRIKSFPLGTLAANILGTSVLGMIWNLQHSQLGGYIGCQVWQGVGDGFCGTLTTVSTWVLELKTLRPVHSYVYALASLGISFAFMVAIMGPLRWTRGFLEPLCVG